MRKLKNINNKETKKKFVPKKRGFEKHQKTNKQTNK